MDNTIGKELRSGSKLENGKYVIERVIGAGGFGITYFARHTLFDEVFAIKEFFINGKCFRNNQSHTVLMHESERENYVQFRAKFIEEARRLKALDHPGIVKIIDVFEENNTSYIVMPFIKGHTLQKTVETKGRLNCSVAVNYIAQLAEAVDYIHKRNILHRDIKPDNMIITPDNKVILIDFGSAREFINDATQQHTSILTQGYAPPEQYSSTSHKGSFSDIYSLGATFYFAVTGRKPFDSVQRLYTDNLQSPRQLFANITPEADRTIMKAMQLKHTNRHQTIQEFMSDLGVETMKLTPAQNQPTINEFKNDSKNLESGIIAMLQKPDTKKTINDYLKEQYKRGDYKIKKGSISSERSRTNKANTNLDSKIHPKKTQIKIIPLMVAVSIIVLLLLPRPITLLVVTLVWVITLVLYNGLYPKSE